MELCYRGVSYDYEPLVMETTVCQVGGKYRGQDWQLCNLKKPPVLEPKDNLTYRGVNYNKHCTITAKTFENKKIQDYLANLEKSSV